jgi:hypothetical protein
MGGSFGIQINLTNLARVSGRIKVAQLAFVGKSVPDLRGTTDAKRLFTILPLRG